MGVSPLTGKERSISTMSSILAHKHMHKHPLSASDFKILSSGTSEWDLLIRESPLISQLNPVLNANIRSIPLELFIYVILTLTILTMHLTLIFTY
jgi:hypothetical protein